ncbi:MAG: glycosyltransferase family 2 protein [Pseudomonadota bacterium]
MEPVLTQIQILMAVYNGASHLEAQLESLAAQSYPQWSLLVSDDGSTDQSVQILRDFAAKHTGRVDLIAGPCRGSAANFLHLLECADTNAAGIAFCDQDDVWLPDKLARAYASLASIPLDQPALYCSRTLVCDAALNVRYPSRKPQRDLSFRNALVQNVVAGNTLVLNSSALKLARQASKQVTQVAVHDWWLYQLLSGAGSAIIHDEKPSLYYRQHSHNEIGAKIGVRAVFSRAVQVIKGRYQGWNSVNISALDAVEVHLTPENRARLREFKKARHGPLPRRLWHLWRSGVHRQGRLGNIALWVSAFLGRI